MNNVAVYILNINNQANNFVTLISADLYDWMFEEMLSGNQSFDIPENLLKEHNSLPNAKMLEKHVVLDEEDMQQSLWKHIMNSSKDYKSTFDAHRAIERNYEYCGEIDIYLD